MLIKVNDRWLNPDHLIEAERIEPERLRVFMLSGNSREFTGATAKYLAARLDALDPLAVPPGPGASVDVTNMVFDDPLPEGGGSSDSENLGAAP